MIELVTLQARPDLASQVFDTRFRAAWPEFMMHDPTADLYFAPPHFAAHHDTAFAVIDPADPGTAIGRAFAVPFAPRGHLPDTGWDGVIRWAHDDRAQGRPRTAVSALEITLLPAYRGRGASALVLRAMAAHLRGLGFAELVVPLRPTAKHLEPFTPMDEYAVRMRPDGLPADPWLRTHVRAGATVVKVAPESMTITAPVAAWASWTGLSFAASGAFAIPGALAPLVIDLGRDAGTYVEPNIWVRHTLGGDVA